jgi:heavy metal sensor kinase
MWYALVLLAAVTGFGAIMYDRARAAKFDQIDTKLRSAALLLDSSLRLFPPQMLDPSRPEPFRGGPDGPPPPGFGEPKGGPPRGEKKGGREPFEHEPDDRRGPPAPQFGKGKGPGGPGLRGGLPRILPERLMAELKLPEEFQGSGDDGYAFVIWRRDGKVFKAFGWADQPLPERSPPIAPSTQPVIYAHSNVREAHLGGPFDSRIMVRRSVGREQAELRTFGWHLVLAGAGVLFVGLVGGWLVSNRMIRPISAMTATAAKISATNLSERIDTANVDLELNDLANVLNDTFARLEKAFEKQAQFTADASHELRTPLAVIRSSAELALSRPRSAEQYQEALATCAKAAQRMANITDGLLTLARADAGQEVAPRTAIALDRVVTDAVTLMKPLADEKQVQLQTTIAPVQVRGDPTALARVVSNLVGNALHYNRPGGAISVSLTNGSDRAVLTVSDTGIGIPAEDLPHVFDRFYRVDKARSRAAGGAGLGLAICKELVQAHGGTIDVKSELNHGTTFTVTMPCAKSTPNERLP